MPADLKINSMAIGAGGRFIFAGMQMGRVAVIDPVSMQPIDFCQCHLGNIYGLAVHPTLPIVASLGMDNRITLAEHDATGRLRLVDSVSTRSIIPWNDCDTVNRNKSQSQAIAFHPALPRLAARGSTAGVMEFDISGGRLEIIHCTRLHGLEDPTTLLYPDEASQLLISAALGSVVYSNDGLELLGTSIGNSNIHWFEPLGNMQFLVASDSRQVLRFDARSAEVVVEGPVMTRDDLEHVHVASDGRAYVAGFDRTIYQIDADTCEPLGRVFGAPFKMRWFKTLPNEPATGFAQCFDGAIYRIDLRRQSLTGSYRRTPPALWTACELPGGGIAMTGEGDEVVEVDLATDENRLAIKLAIVQQREKPEADSYTKRMVADGKGNLFLGQTSGAVLRLDRDGRSSVLAHFDSAVRDLAVDQSGQNVFLCLERGAVLRIDAYDGSVLASRESAGGMPLWALALNEQRGLLAVAERSGRLWLLDLPSLSPVEEGPQCGRTKRVKWFDDDIVVYNMADALMRYDLRTGQSQTWVPAIGNTIEDFCWSKEYGYLFFISYTTQIGMCDLDTGDLLYVGSDQEDYSKGLMCVHSNPKDRYPLHVLTFGRRATVCGYRPHCDMLTPLGPMAEPLLTHRYVLDRQPDLADA